MLAVHYARYLKFKKWHEEIKRNRLVSTNGTYATYERNGTMFVRFVLFFNVTVYDISLIYMTAQSDKNKR